MTEQIPVGMEFRLLLERYRLNARFRKRCYTEEMGGLSPEEKVLYHASPQQERRQVEPNREKRCTRCKEVKPIGAFGRDRSSHSGLQSACRPCKKAQKERWQQQKEMNQQPLNQLAA